MTPYLNTLEVGHFLYIGYNVPFAIEDDFSILISQRPPNIRESLSSTIDHFLLVGRKCGGRERSRRSGRKEEGKKNRSQSLSVGVSACGVRHNLKIYVDFYGGNYSCVFRRSFRDRDMSRESGGHRDTEREGE